MTHIVVIPADTGIAIGTFIFDNQANQLAYTNPIMYDSFTEAVDDYHKAVVNGGELPFHLDEGLQVWLLDLDSGLCCCFWAAYQAHLGNTQLDKTIASTASAIKLPLHDSPQAADLKIGTLLHQQLEQLAAPKFYENSYPFPQGVYMQSNTVFPTPEPIELSRQETVPIVNDWGQPKSKWYSLVRKWLFKE
jgi:hypothetical protein